MSNGPVYCPQDGTELQPCSCGYECPECGLLWNARFPVYDMRPVQERAVPTLKREVADLRAQLAAAEQDKSRAEGVLRKAPTHPLIVWAKDYTGFLEQLSGPVCESEAYAALKDFHEQYAEWEQRARAYFASIAAQGTAEKEVGDGNTTPV